MNNEEIYDQRIAPLMTQIIEICQANNIGLHATFFLGDVPVQDGEPKGEMNITTHLLCRPVPVTLRLMYYLYQSDGNFDRFIFRVKKDAEKNGHTSAALYLLGVPMKEERRT